MTGPAIRRHAVGVFFLVAACAPLWSWGDAGPGPLPSGYSPIRHPVRNQDFWLKHAVGQKGVLASKISLPMPEILDYLLKDNQLNGFATLPSPPVSDSVFFEDVRASLDELPAIVKNYVADRVEGIFIVRDLGSTAFTDFVVNSEQDATSAFIALDQTAIDRTANEWVAWKERTPFKKNPSFRIEGTLETSRRNDRKHAIQYILLHEIGHVFARLSGLGPSTEDFFDARTNPESFPFTKLSWKQDGQGASIGRNDKTFGLRKKVKYYRQENERLDPALAFEAYRQLLASDFATLYGATNPHDDFAEAFANYVHVVLMKQPYELKLIQDGKVRMTIGSCWEEPRCQAKKRILDRVFRGVKF